ncbi:MAG: aldo/keto reductase [Chloroflexi bacterium]|nr:aldo/keto reductase [Chloroflexota bacterium]
MQTRKLGWTDLNLTTVGFGAWAIGGGDWLWSWGAQDDRDSIAAIRHALDLGVNWIDTAAVYGLGHSETVVGHALQGLSHKPFVATKCSLVWDSLKNVSNCLKRDSVLAEVDASLNRLQVDVIDLYQIHWPSPDPDIEEGWAAIGEAIRAGKVRYAGVSNFDVAQLRRAQAVHPVASLQPPYSMLARGVETELLAFCAEHRIGVVAYSPMQKGLLTGAFTLERASNLASDDHRRSDPDFREPRLTAHLELVDALRPIAERYGRSVAQLAIAWVLRRPEVTAAIVGARTPQQIDETLGGGDWTLSAADAQEIEVLLGDHDRKLAQSPAAAS